MKTSTVLDVSGISLLAFLCLLTTGCLSGEMYDNKMAYSKMPEEEMAFELISESRSERLAGEILKLQHESPRERHGKQDTHEPAIDRMLIRNGAMDVSVRDLNGAAERVRALVKSQKGYIAKESEDENQIEMRLRIPSENLDQIFIEFGELGKVTYKNLESLDVTERHQDLDAALKNLLKLRDRLKSLLDKASSVNEILNVEKELTRVQTEIDQLTGKLKLLRSRVSYSRVHLTIEKRSMDGPVTILYKGGAWAVRKLFVID